MMGCFNVENVMKRIRESIQNRIHILLPLATVICLFGFIGSLLLPDTVLDTYHINMAEAEGDTEQALVLSDGAHIGYQMDTIGRAMRGIQVGISKFGKTLSGILCYDVYVISGADKTLVSHNEYDIAGGDDLQYVYLPYASYEQCVGALLIDFYMQSPLPQEIAPGIMANHTKVDNVTTFYLDEQSDMTLKSNYIYTHKTYPFLYDFRLLTCIFLAATMAVKFPVKKQRKAVENHAE